MMTKQIPAIACIFIVCSFFFSTLIAQAVNRGALTITISSGIATFRGLEDRFDVGGSWHGNLAFGFYPATDFGFGIELNASNITLDNEPYGAAGLGPFLRLYVSKNIYLHASFDAGFVGDDLYEYNKLNFSIGYSFFLGKNFAVEPKIFYSKHNESGREFDFHGPGIGVGMQLFSNRH